MRPSAAIQSPDAILGRLKQLPGLIVITGNEPLLVMEAADKVRERARQEGFTDRHSFVMDSRSDWQQIALAAGSGSLFGDRQLIEITMASAKPGKSGAQAIAELARNQGQAAAQDALVLFRLPSLDRPTRDSSWCKALMSHATVMECPDVSRTELPAWIKIRLGLQDQQADADTLTWMADHVEGNLLAAHQEILKLGLLYPAGPLSMEQVQSAVMNVARYDVMDLRDAALDGDADRALRILNGLEAEGTASQLALWALSEDVRLLTRVREGIAQGQRATDAMRALRIFGVREQKLSRLMNRMGPEQAQSFVAHAHDVDRLGKGIPVAGRLNDVWQELARLAMRLATSRAR